MSTALSVAEIARLLLGDLCPSSFTEYTRDLALYHAFCAQQELSESRALGL